MGFHGFLDNGISYIMQKVAIAILVLSSTDRSADSNKEVVSPGPESVRAERKEIRLDVPILLLLGPGVEDGPDLLAVHS